MASTVMSTQLNPWNYEKPTMATRSERCSSDSSASSPTLCNDRHDTLRLDTAATQPTKKGSISLQDRYMSSEEDLSPAYEDSGSESEYDYDAVVVEDLTKQCHSAQRMSMSRWNQGKSCDTAVKVSYAFVGRPKVVELNLSSPALERPILQQRSVSLANLPATAMSKTQKVDQVQRHSLNVVPVLKRPISPLARPISPLAVIEPRRPSTSYSPSSKTSTLNIGDLTSAPSSVNTAPSSRSASPAVSAPIRPASATPETASSRRSSVYIPTGARPELQRGQTTQTQFRFSHQTAPPTPMSPATHAFLNTDPFAKPAGNTAIPANKPSTHRRLRSISMKLSLARIAITPSSKKSANNAPVSPYTPLTPQTAPIEATSGFASPMPNKLRRASTILRPKSRGGDPSRGPSPEMAPPVPVLNRASTMGLPQRQSKMVARGADEREPTLVLPPFADTDMNPMAAVKSGKLRKRKSLMDLL
ncbi:uncharacterized protein EKO05_0009961 [Ascochyta rabiei]|uniref:Uncharacterized protein n=1 Tax=Didymella rabiei TaxID=5454 RepID=A0A162WQP9_DIDRA|nr:uncharacterized protein EKO05_0009961 [Ascochyta rabiei]KZM19167.1 hypothetical protein ST47_g9679 [Ascochyta rabiei]UPX19707.1 hypothetical protein EKO05_0009961 [Ascochyta rabiei]